MKKILAILAAAVLAGGMLIGCEEESSSSGSSSKVESSSVVDSSSQSDSSAAESSSEADSSNTDSSSEANDSKPNGIVTEPVEPDPDSSAPDSSTPDSSKPDAESGRFVKMLRNIKSSRCLMIKTGDLTGSSSYSIITDGTYIYMELNSYNQTYQILNNDQGSYILDAANKKYYADSTSSFAPGKEEISELIDDITDDVDDFKYVSSGTKTVDGVTYESEKYADALDSDDLYEILFDKNGNVCYVIDDKKTTPMLLSDKVDFDFSLPSDYTEMTEAELGALFGFDGDMDFDPEDDDFDDFDDFD